MPDNLTRQILREHAVQSGDRERSQLRRELCPRKHTPALPVEHGDEAGAGSAAPDVLDGSEKPPADMR